MSASNRERILEEQVDALAGRVTMLEDRWERMIEWLCRESTHGRLAIDVDSIRRGCHTSAVRGATAELAHANDRYRRITDAERERVLDDLVRAARQERPARNAR